MQTMAVGSLLKSGELLQGETALFSVAYTSMLCVSGRSSVVMAPLRQHSYHQMLQSVQPGGRLRMPVYVHRSMPNAPAPLQLVGEDGHTGVTSTTGPDWVMVKVEAET